MENEKKDIQTTEESREEKVRQDISEKIAEAAAEIQEEINEASEVEEVVEAVAEEAAEDAVEADESWSDEAFIEPAKEPKKVTMNLSSLVLSWVGTAVLGALILFLGYQIPGWIEARPEGKTVMTVDGAKVTDLDMNYYLYEAAVTYFQNDEEAAMTYSNPSEYDWDKDLGDGKTVADVVRENAIDIAINENNLMNAGDKNGVEWDEEKAKTTAKGQIDQLEGMYGEEIPDLYVVGQGLSTRKQYAKKIMQSIHMQAVSQDIEANPSKYFPEDTAVLNEFAPKDKATVKHILLSTEQEEGEAPVDKEEVKAKAEEILARAKNGEDFDALVKEFNQDPGATEAGYTFGPGEMQPAFEEAAFALGLGEVSELVETDYGYHIIKRFPGRFELEGYWKSQANIKIKESRLEKISIKEILEQAEAAMREIQTKLMEMQNK